MTTIFNKVSKEQRVKHIKSIKKHLLLHGNISSIEAIYEYGNTRLAATIYVLRKRKWKIESIWENNATTRWVRYYLRENEVLPLPSLFD